MSGTVGDLSPEQQKALEEFRVLASDALQAQHDDYFLLRWLRARKFDLRKANEAMRKCLKWRKELGVDTILTDFTIPEVIRKHIAGGTIGQDKEGFAVFYQPCAWYSFDVKGALKSVSFEELISVFVYQIEISLQASKVNGEKLGKVIEKCSLIVDLKDFRISVLWNTKVVCLLYACIKIYQDFYAEHMKRMYIINFSSMFEVLYRLLKRYMDKDIFKKMQIYGADEYQMALLEDIDAEVLPAFLGGKRVDPDGNPRCPSLVGQGAVFDPKYYMKNACKQFADKPDVKLMIVAARSEALVEVDVPQKDAVIQWEFLTGGSDDIGVGLRYRSAESTDEEDVQELVTTEKVQCSETPKKREFHCSRPGTYIIIFDNTYSWFRQKSVHYRIRVQSSSIAFLDRV